MGGLKLAGCLSAREKTKEWDSIKSGTKWIKSVKSIIDDADKKMLFSGYQSLPPLLNEKEVWTTQQVQQIETLRNDFKKLNDYKDLGKLYVHCLTELCKGAYEKREVVTPTPRLRAVSDLDLAFGFPVMALFLSLP